MSIWSLGYSKISTTSQSPENITTPSPILTTSYRHIGTMNGSWIYGVYYDPNLKSMVLRLAVSVSDQNSYSTVNDENNKPPFYYLIENRNPKLYATVKPLIELSASEWLNYNNFNSGSTTVRAWAAPLGRFLIFYTAESVNMIQGIQFYQEGM
jgi:hypothetical protein